MCILLRELITAGVIIDAALGLPIIHCNFLDYDEQAHRRGPSSTFAHWTLKGIDNCIRRIWQFAKSLAYRDYEIWIYSDHGQEATIPYEALEERTVQSAVGEILQHLGLKASETISQSVTIQFKRIVRLGIRRLQRLLRQSSDSTQQEKFKIIADGPVAHLYLFAPLSQKTRNNIGQALVENTHIPAVITANDDATIQVWMKKGRFCLPEEAVTVLGEKHPFLEDVPMDLVRLAHHPDAGIFVLFGWGAREHPLNFGYENGGHGGFGPEETHGFAILSDDAPLRLGENTYLRPLDLRQAVLRFLHRTPRQENAPFRIRNRTPHVLRVMTYNVHSCIGMDGKLSPDRLARIIAAYDPDVVALQEVDVNHSRTGGIDQARQLARMLNMEYHFHPSYIIAEGQYGNAIFSRLPMRVVKTGSLPEYRRREPRGIIWVEIECHTITLQLFNTHLGLRPGERMAQVRRLLGPNWLAHPDCREPVVVCGDFNGLPHSKMYRKITRHLQDTRRVYHKAPVPPTWKGVARLDYIFTTPGIEVLEMLVPRTHLTRKASDHFPVLVDLQFKPPV